MRLDRRGTVELMNDAQFLLENHIMQPDAASTPLRQLYFVIQTMILDPVNAHLTTVLLQSQASLIKKHSKCDLYLQVVSSAEQLVQSENFFEALKVLRKSFLMEDQLLSGQTQTSKGEVRAA